MRLKLFLLTLFFCITHIAQAQTYTIRGKIVDAETGKPIAFAHVGVPEYGYGTATSETGTFILKIPARYARTSTLSVSFLGYENFKKSAYEIREYITIKLKPSPTNLVEILVLDERAVEDIIRKAVKAIPKNYPTHPTTVLGFYRESRTDKNGDYIYIAEGVLNIYKKSYRSKGEGQVSLVQGRQVVLIDPEEFSSYSGFSSGHQAGHRFDFVKNREDFIDEDYFEAYKYWLKGVTTYNDRPVYMIGFDQNENDPDGRMKGTMYIDTLSYAFLRAEFEILPDGLRKFNDYPLYAGSWRGNRYVVNYKKLEDKWFFSDALREGDYRDGGVYTNEILITEINPKRSKSLPYNERLSRGSQFLKLTGEYDEDFWKDYNTSPLSVKLEESLQQQQNNQKAEEVFDSTFFAALQAQRDSAMRARMIETADSQMLGELGELGEISTSPTEVARQVKRFRLRFQPSIAAGTHLFEGSPSQIGITYLDENSEAIVSFTDELDPNAYEILTAFDMNIFLNKNLFIRWGSQRDFYTNIYREKALGIGAQVNLSRRRPFLVRATAQHSNLKYAQRLGQATTTYGEFEAAKKTFKSETINLYYGSRTHNLKVGAELSIELNPGLQLFARGNYYIPFATREDIYLWERDRFFRKKVSIPVSDNQVLVTRDGQPFSGSLVEDNSMFFAIGVVIR